jgi:putative spermidine/putrescine transport system permease protein
MSQYLDLPDSRDQELTLTIPVLKGVLWLLIALVGLLVVLPSIYLVIWAFRGSETVGLLAPSLSIDWFKHVLSNPEWRESLAYSLILAIVTSFAGCVVLTIHFYFSRYTSIFEHLTYGSTLLVVLIPPVAYAISLRIIGGAIGIPEMLLMAFGHLVFVIPLQFFVLESREESLSSDLLFAGSTLGASHFRNIIFVYLPAMKKALWGAFLVGAFLSFDELVIATFVLDSSLVTVPRRLWDQVNRNMDPSPAVISLLVAGSYIFILIAAWAQRRLRRLWTHWDK